MYFREGHTPVHVYNRVSTVHACWTSRGSPITKGIQSTCTCVGTFVDALKANVSEAI